MTAEKDDESAGEPSRPRRRSSRGGSRRKKDPSENAASDTAADDAPKTDAVAEKPAANDTPEDAEESASV